MITSRFRTVFFALFAFAWVISVHAELPILTKARAFLGAEADLEGVKSVHYVGTLVTSDPADANKPESAAVDIVFQKPGQQRISITYEKAVEQTALDGYDAWQRQQDPSDPAKWRQTLLSADQIKRLRANTLENLMFFRGIDRVGGKIEDLGPVNVDGVACHKIAFIHGPNIVFTRYFESATGRLVLTETEAGGAIREQGSMVVNEVRFPKTIITVTKAAGGKAQMVTINFEKIMVNELFPPSFFAVPALSNR